MNKFEELLSGIDVEEISLSNKKFFLLENSKRKPVKASSRVSGVTPYYGANNVQDYVEGFTHDGEYLLIAEDGTKSVEDYSIQYVKGKLWANNHVHVISGTGLLNNRYLYHFLKSFNFIPFLTGGGRAKLTKASLFCIKIPIPCPDDPEKSLAIQAEIVRILDTFTDLTTELESELVARRGQFDFYRNQMFHVNDNKISGVDVKWLPLGELADISTGSSNRKDESEDGIYPLYVRSANILKSNSYQYNEEAIIIPGEGGVGEIFHYVNGKYALHQRAYRISPKLKPINVRYFYHYIKANFKSYIISKSVGATSLSIRKPMLEKYKLPIPCPEEPEKSLAFQAEIVEKLDKFDALVNSVEEGLPKEIELRHKQYEYYRDMLFGLLQKEE